MLQEGLRRLHEAQASFCSFPGCSFVCRVAQTPRFPQTPEIQVSGMFVPHMSGSCCTHHVDIFRVKGFLILGYRVFRVRVFEGGLLFVGLGVFKSLRLIVFCLGFGV